MITKIKKLIINSVIMLTPLLAVGLAAAPVSAVETGTTASQDKCGSGITFFPSWYKGICDPNTGQVISPGSDKLGSDTSTRLSKWITIIAMNIVTMILYIVGYVSLAFTIYGGFKYMISGDNSSGTLAARKTITNAVIGLVLSIMSVALVTFVSGAIV